MRQTETFRSVWCLVFHGYAHSVLHYLEVLETDRTIPTTVPLHQLSDAFPIFGNENRPFSLGCYPTSAHNTTAYNTKAKWWESTDYEMNAKINVTRIVAPKQARSVSVEIRKQQCKVMNCSGESCQQRRDRKYTVKHCRTFTLDRLRNKEPLQARTKLDGVGAKSEKRKTTNIPFSRAFLFLLVLKKRLHDMVWFTNSQHLPWLNPTR